MKMNARIYVMQAQDGMIKLGHSRNPVERAKQVGRAVDVVTAQWSTLGGSVSV